MLWCFYAVRSQESELFCHQMLLVDLIWILALCPPFSSYLLFLDWLLTASRIEVWHVASDLKVVRMYNRIVLFWVSNDEQWRTIQEGDVTAHSVRLISGKCCANGSKNTILSNKRKKNKNMTCHIKNPVVFHLVFKQNRQIMKSGGVEFLISAFASSPYQVRRRLRLSVHIVQGSKDLLCICDMIYYIF